MNTRTILASSRPSAALARACACFGLRVRRDDLTGTQRNALHLARYADDARQLESMLAPGRIVLVTGESGSGKSTLLELLRRRLRLTRRKAIVVTHPPAPRRQLPVIDLFKGAPQRRLRTLSACAMGDATLLARRPSELSEGQRARLAIALAAQHARKGDTLICDEFASTLDRITALGLAHALSRWAAREQVQVVVATGNDDVAGPLNASVFRTGSMRRRAA